MATVLGIDLGTSAIRGALLVDGPPAVLEAPDGASEIPAVVSYIDLRPKVGRAAAAGLLTHPERTVAGAKALLFAAEDDPRRKRLAPVGVSPEQVLVALVRALKELADKRVRGRVADAVIGMSVGLDDSDAVRLERIISEAGLGARFFPEPVCVAANLPGFPERAREVLLVDVGAGATTVARLGWGPGRMEIRHLAWEEVGGDDVDRRLVDRMLDNIGGSGAGPLARELVRQCCEALKRDIGGGATCSVPLPFPPPGLPDAPQVLTLDRAGLTAALAPSLDRIAALVSEVAAATGMREGDKVELHLSGGMVRSPPVRAALEGAAGRRAREGLHPSAALALGAAQLGVLASARGGLELRTLGPRSATRRAATAPQPPRPSAPMVAAAILSEAAMAPTERPPPAATPPPPRLTPPSQRPTPPPQASASTAPTPPPGGRPLTPAPPPPAPPPSAPPRIDTISPPGMASVPPIAGNERVRGRIANATTPKALLALPMDRALGREDLATIALPVLLLRVMARSSTRGLLTLDLGSPPPLDVPIDKGQALLSPREYAAVVKAMAVPSGRYDYDPRGEPPKASRQPYRFLRVVFDGLRGLARQFHDDDVLAAFGGKRELAPRVRAGREKHLPAIGFTSAELRFIDQGVRGELVLEETIGKSSIGRASGLGILLILATCDFLDFVAIERVVKVPGDDLRKRAEAMAAANDFDVMGVHWSATAEEIEQVHKRLEGDLKKGGPLDLQAPEACAAMRARVEEAYRRLSNPEERVKYRAEMYPNIDFAMVGDLLQQQAQAVAMRDDREAGRVSRALHDIRRTSTLRPPRKSSKPDKDK